MSIVAYLLSCLCLLLNGFLFLRLRWPYRLFVAWPPQLLAGALSPFLLVAGGLGAALGWLSHAPVAVAAGALSAGISAYYLWRVAAAQPGFALAFGADWPRRLTPQQESRLLPSRWGIGLPRAGEPRWERDVPFWTIPTDRQLLCDIWQPPDGVARTGLGLIYLHGSAWYLFDKDLGTRPFFRQLTAQGHVVMDVAYRLCPEVDIHEMVGDVKRAVAWLKANADRYHVDPDRIVVGGASAGGHLALLAAYARTHPRLTPADVQGCDLAVRAVVSYYGPTDLRAVYEYTRQERLTGLPKVQTGLPPVAGQKNNKQDAGRLDILLGGHLHECPAEYELASPIAHVHAGCPPTLLIQGELDAITPAAATRALHRRLVECGVPAINIIYPLTNHAFDLVLPQVSPSTRAALYDLERFLALVA